jgi:co-chaperonin GroES (HSP10)
MGLNADYILSHYFIGGIMGLDPGKIRPIGDKVLVKCRLTPDVKTSGGIFLPGKVGYNEQAVGEVVSVGPGKYWDSGPYKGKFLPMWVKPGDVVLFTISGAEPIRTDDTAFHYEILLSETQILGTL